VSETIITILDRERGRGSDKKTLVQPSKRPEYIGRRRLHNAAITFYDTAYIKDGDTYRDLPILKVPSVTVSAVATPFFQGAKYVSEAFTDADFAAYIDLLFEVPVTEWKHNYRKIEYELNAISSPTGNIAIPNTYPPSIALRDGATTHIFVDDFSADISTPEGRAARTSDLSTYKFCWDSRGLEYRDMTRLRLVTPSQRVFGSSITDPEWFNLDTDDTNFKITATNDSSAPDVSDTLTFSGNIDVYLISRVGLFVASSVQGPREAPGDEGYQGTEGVQVLGPWYQALPRSYWPAYVDPYVLTDWELRKDDFIEYQKSRTDAVASLWTWDGAFGITTGSLDPADFKNGNFTWKSTIENTAVPGTFYSGSTAQTFFNPEPTIDGTVYYLSDTPSLMAVLKIHGAFYYVWSVAAGGRITTATSECNVSIPQYVTSVYPPGDIAP